MSREYLYFQDVISSNCIQVHSDVRMRSQNVPMDPAVFLITGFAMDTKIATMAVTRPTAVISL